jgi:hypothetical protein
MALTPFSRTSVRRSLAFGGSIALVSRGRPDITDDLFSTMDNHQHGMRNSFLAFVRTRETHES